MKQMKILKMKKSNDVGGLKPPHLLIHIHGFTINFICEGDINNVDFFFGSTSSTNNTEIIITQSNADYGGLQMNELFINTAKTNRAFHYIPTLGQLRYLSFMKEVVCVVGNSSSGIVETPHLGIPTVNIGERQTGRHMCANIITCGIGSDSIKNAIDNSIAHGKYIPDKYFGDGHASERIVNQIKIFLT